MGSADEYLDLFIRFQHDREVFSESRCNCPWDGREPNYPSGPYPMTCPSCGKLMYIAYPEHLRSFDAYLRVEVLR